MIEQLRNEVPHAFSSRHLAAESSVGLKTGELTLGELEIQKLHTIGQVLRNPELQHVIGEGKLTLGIIKPYPNEGKGLPQSDEEAARIIREEIGDENIVFELSTVLSGDELDLFYRDVKEKYSGKTDMHGVNLWESIKGFMGSGPLTFMLLKRDQGDAITWWRERMGNTYASQADPNSIRGRYADEDKLPNNITHGSDSPEALKHELSALAQIVENLESDAVENAEHFPSADTISRLHIVLSPDDVVSIKQLDVSKATDRVIENSYEVAVIDEEKVVDVYYLTGRSFITPDNSSQEKAINEYMRAQKLIKIGIPTPRMYGVLDGVLYEEYIPSSHTQKIFATLANHTTLSNDEERAFESLIDMATQLDNAGLMPRDFLSDIVYDPASNTFKYSNFEVDLNKASELPISENMDNLRSKLSLPFESKSLRHKVAALGK